MTSHTTENVSTFPSPRRKKRTSFIAFGLAAPAVWAPSNIGKSGTVTVTVNTTATS